MDIHKEEIEKVKYIMKNFNLKPIERFYLEQYLNDRRLQNDKNME
jgi:hypothetical protein